MKSLLVAAAAFVAAFAFAPVAVADNWPDPQLDAAATSIAGHPVSVYCENSWYPWENYFAQQGQDGTWILGFTRPSVPVVYLSPRACETLHALYAFGPAEVGNYYASLSVLTLTHESTHQRGITDEGQTDCAALAVIADVAVRFFGYHQTVQEAYLARVTLRVGHRRVPTYVVRYRTVADPLLADFVAFAHAWHKTKPPEYQGGC